MRAGEQCAAPLPHLGHSYLSRALTGLVLEQMSLVDSDFLAESLSWVGTKKKSPEKLDTVKTLGPVLGQIQVQGTAQELVLSCPRCSQ